jgi:hypothetical protein
MAMEQGPEEGTRRDRHGSPERVVNGEGNQTAGQPDSREEMLRTQVAETEGMNMG